MNKRNKEILNKKVNDKQKFPDERNTLDKFKDQQYVDDIPLEDLKVETEQETKKKQTQSTSQSERNHQTGFDDE